jgi:hypothetical protein
MSWRDRANVIRRFYACRFNAEPDAWRLAGRRRAEAGREVQGGPEHGIRSSLVDRGVASIVGYHEAGETDEAFEALRQEAAALADAAARLGLGCEAIEELIFGPVRTRVHLMYDEKTAERLMVAFECGRHPAG